MEGWYAEFRREGRDGEMEPWQRVGGPYKTQERAKGECRKVFRGSVNNQAGWWFRTIDERGMVYQISVPPHAWRLRWVNAF